MVAAGSRQGRRPQIRRVVFTENDDNGTFLSKASSPYPSIGVPPSRTKHTSHSGGEDAPPETMTKGTMHVWLLTSSSKGQEADRQFGGSGSLTLSKCTFVTPCPSLFSLLGGSFLPEPPRPTPQDKARAPHCVPPVISQAGIRKDRSNYSRFSAT